MRTVAYILFGLLFFQSCQEATPETKKKSANPIEAEVDYLSIGKNYAIQTKNALGQQLAHALGKGGHEYALSFCNSRAIALTDSVSQSVNATVKRVSDRPRNVNNEANESELAFIIELKKRLEDKEPMKPKLVELDHKMVAYYPILTNGMCIQCHGQIGTDIAAGTQKKLNELYPSDLATDYSSDQLRGLFVVEMDKK